MLEVFSITLIFSGKLVDLPPILILCYIISLVYFLIINVMYVNDLTIHLIYLVFQMINFLLLVWYF